MRALVRYPWPGNSESCEPLEPEISNPTLEE
jgi:hypothetical protein